MIPVLLVAAAFAQDDSRDTDIFGAPSEPPPETPTEEEGEEETPPANPPPPADPEQDPFLGEVDIDRTSDDDIFRRIAERDDTFTIGGMMFLRVQGTLRDEQKVADSPMTSPNLLDLYADARPNDRLRAYTRVRLTHDFTVQSGDTDPFGNERTASNVVLDQLWLKGDVAKRVFWTVGRQRIKWGAGRFWNPTDFLNPVLDPLAVFDVRTGQPLVKVHVPFEGLGGNVYAIADLRGADEARDVGGALRAEWLVGNTELSATVFGRENDPIRLGADLSTGLWIFDLYVEGAVRQGDDSDFWEGELDFDTFTVPTTVDRSEDWIPQVVAGIQTSARYNDEDAVYVGIEAFYNDAGYDSPDLYTWLLFQGQLQFFYLGREYASVFVSLPGPGRWDDHTFTATSLNNLSDGSGVARLDWNAVVLTHLRVNAFAGYHYGTDEGELRFGLDIPPVPTQPGLEEGLHLEPMWIDLGVGATLNF